MLLVAYLANTKWRKKTEKWLKPWHMGTHLRVLFKSYPMNTNMTGFGWCKKPRKLLKPWHIGTHLRVLSEHYPMNTNTAGFRWFSKFCDIVLWMKVASALEGLSMFVPTQKVSLFAKFWFLPIFKKFMNFLFCVSDKKGRSLTSTIRKRFSRSLLRGKPRSHSADRAAVMAREENLLKPPDSRGNQPRTTGTVDYQ